MNLEEMEKRQTPHGEVALVGLGRLGLRTALNLMQIHRGGPERIYAIDGQKISGDDLIFRMIGGSPGEYKTTFLDSLAEGSRVKVTGVPCYVTKESAHLVRGDVVCIEIAGGDTLPVTAAIIKAARRRGAATISTMGVFGIGGEKISAVDISEADVKNPVVEGLRKEGISSGHLLVGTGKLIRDWEPVTPYVLDGVAREMTAEILRALEEKR